MSGSLLSPGSLVTLTDDTFGVGSGTGTIPLFIIGTHENKTQPNSTSLASGTVTGTGGEVTAVSSQRELINTFGNPIFYTKNGTPQNAYELNEYGLLAAYHYLGLADNAYILRGDVDYYQLAPSTTAPYSSLTNKTFWLNSTTSAWGIFLNDGKGTSTSWNYQKPYVISSNSNMGWVIRGTVGWPDVSESTLGEGIQFGGTTYSGISENGSITITLDTGHSLTVPYETTDTLSDVYSNIQSAIKKDTSFNTVSIDYVSYNSITSNITSTETQNVDKVYAGTAWTLGTTYQNNGTVTNPVYDVAPPSAGVTYNVTNNNEITTSTVVNGSTLVQTMSIVPVGSSSKVTTVTNTFTLSYSVDVTTNITYLQSFTFVEQKQMVIEQGIYLQIAQSSINSGLNVNGPAEVLELLGLYAPTSSTTTSKYSVANDANASQKTLSVSGNFTLDANQSAIISQSGSGASVSLTSASTTTYAPNTILLANAGTGYAVNDSVVIESVGTITVNTISTGGGISTFTLTSPLSSSTDMAGTNIASSGGTGTGATFTVTSTKTVTYHSSNLSLLSGGTGYTLNSVYKVGPNNDTFKVTSVNKNGIITGIVPTLDEQTYSTDMANANISVENAIQDNSVVLSSTYDSSTNTSTLTLDKNLNTTLSASVSVTVTVTTSEQVDGDTNVAAISTKMPNPSYGTAISGQAGIFAVVSGKAEETSDTSTYGNVKIYQKVGGSYIDTGVVNQQTGVNYSASSSYTWMVVGSEEWRNINGNSFNFDSTLPTGSFSNGDVIIKTSSQNNGTSINLGYYDPKNGSWVSKSCNIYGSDSEAELNIGNDDYTVYAQYQTTELNDPEAFYKLKLALNSGWYDINTESVQNNVVLFGSSSNANILSYYFQDAEPEGNPEDDTLWFNNDIFADIMVGDGENWYGYRNYFPNTDANGVIISGSKPTVQSTGDALVDNDLWIDSSDTENYPLIYRFSSATNTWSKIDNTNSINGYGIIFEDARWTDDGDDDGSQNASDLIISNYLDPDAPDARLYKKGTLLFNTRASTNNVKVWKENWLGGEYNGTDYITRGYNIGQPTATANLGSYGPVSSTGRWVTKSGNNESGAPYMGRKAQRQIIVEALKAAVLDNENIRSELMNFTLICAPGYTELLSDMVELNADKNYTAFVVGDTPARLQSDTASLTAYATNTTAVTDGDDGIITSDGNLSVYYPWGLSTNTDGTSVVVPPSHMAIYTIAYSDSISYPWMAPAGTTRGLVKNASSVGYVDGSGNYISVTLSAKQNNILYPNNINAILRYPTTGLVIMGDKTRCADSTSALTRINVARLCSYVRYNLTIMTRRFLFEQNVQTTRNSAKSLVDKFFTNLVSLNAVTDFITVCDTSNNTSERIDNNELWIDAAIVPARTIDFVYIPIRLENTGTDLSTLYSISSS